MNKFVLNFAQRLNLRSSNKHVALQNLAIYYTWKDIRKQSKNNKFKTITPPWNDNFESLARFYSRYSRLYRVQKEHQILTTNPPIHFCIHRIDNSVQKRGIYIRIRNAWKKESKLMKLIKKLGRSKWFIKWRILF